MSLADELHLALVVSTKAHAEILHIDATEALSMPGVTDFVSYKDVPGKNRFGVICQDEEIFASEMVSLT